MEHFINFNIIHFGNAFLDMELMQRKYDEWARTLRNNQICSLAGFIARGHECNLKIMWFLLMVCLEIFLEDPDNVG